MTVEFEALAAGTGFRRPHKGGQILFKIIETPNTEMETGNKT